MARGLKSEDAFRPPPNLLDLAEMSTAEGSAELPLASGGSDVQDHMKVGLYICSPQLSTLPALSLPSRERHSFIPTR